MSLVAAISAIIATAAHAGPVATKQKDQQHRKPDADQNLPRVVTEDCSKVAEKLHKAAYPGKKATS